jgi:hypothetical protein
MFSYPGDYQVASKFEEQTTAMIREYKGEDKYLAPHHPDGGRRVRRRARRHGADGTRGE